MIKGDPRHPFGSEAEKISSLNVCVEHLLETRKQFVKANCVDALSYVLVHVCGVLMLYALRMVCAMYRALYG